MAEGKNGQLDSQQVDAYGSRVAQGIPAEGADGAFGHEFERKEVLKSMDMNWDDEYIAEFGKEYPSLIGPFADDIGRMAAMDRNSPDYAMEKSKLFGKIIPVLDESLSGIYKRIGELTAALQVKRTPEDRAQVSGALSLNRQFSDDISFFKNNAMSYQVAYERFSDNRAEIERKLLKRIKAGGISIPEGLPYVMFVNKNPKEQYSVIYKYDRAKQELSLKSCNIVSTGDALRYREEEGEDYDHSTPSRVYYVGLVTGLHNSSVREVADVYGWESMRIDQKPYQIFRLYKAEDGGYIRTSYIVHPTNEEPLLGKTASHGCIRTTRLMNTQLQKMYDEYFRKQGVTDLMRFPPDGEWTPRAKMPVVIDDISQ